MLRYRAPSGFEPIAGTEAFECDTFHRTVFLFSSEISSLFIPSHDSNTSSLCWPSNGGGKRTDAGVAENFTGIPAMDRNQLDALHVDHFGIEAVLFKEICFFGCKERIKVGAWRGVADPDRG